MKIYVGNPLNALEFVDLDIMLSTSGWLLYSQTEVVGLLNRDYIECYINSNKTYLNKDNRFMSEKDILISFGFTKDVLNFEFYFLSLIYKVDLIVFSMEFSNNIIDKIYSHIHSNVRKVNIPSLIINNNNGVTKISYIIPNYKNEFVIKDAIYVFLDYGKKGNYMFTFGKYLSDLKETLHSFDVKVMR